MVFLVFHRKGIGGPTKGESQEHGHCRMPVCAFSDHLLFPGDKDGHRIASSEAADAITLIPYFFTWLKDAHFKSMPNAFDDAHSCRLLQDLPLQIKSSEECFFIFIQILFNLHAITVLEP